MTRRKSPHDLDTFHAHLDALKLSFIREHYPDVVRRAAEEQSDHLSVLERLIEGEANLRRDRSIERRIRLARFPVKKTLDSFDWSWPNKINRLQVQNLFRLRFLDDAANVVLVGGVGLGKSHLVTALGLQACERGYSVLFTSAIDAINTLAAAKAAGQLKRDLRRYLRPRLLILDELGYLLSIPSFNYQMTPKISLNTRCSISISENLSINGQTRSSDQLGIWSYNINP